MPPRTRGVTAADIELIKSMMENTISQPIDNLPTRAIAWFIEWIDESFGRLQQMKADGEINEDELPTITTMQSAMQRIRFNCLMNLSERPQTPSATTSSVVNRHSTLKREDIPFFDGSPLEWPQFWTVFKDLVWNNPAVTDPKEKLRRLYTSVASDVRRILPNLDCLTLDLDEIAADLEAEFGDAIKIHHAFRDVIREVPTFKRNNDVQGWLRIEKIAKQLKSHHPIVDAEHQKALQLLATKLPNYESWNFLEQRDFSADKLIELCRNKLRANERFLPNLSQEQTVETNLNRRNQAMNRDRNNRFNVNTSVSSTKCSFCSGQHLTPDCRLSLRARRDIIVERKGCYVCLEPYVTGHECQPSETCSDCRQRHSSLISCRPVRGFRQQRPTRNEASQHARTPENRTPRSTNETRSESNDERVITESTTNTNLTQAGWDTRRYSSIIQVQVEYQGCTRRVRALLDGCSDVSYVTRACVDKLKAPIIDNGLTQTASFNNEKKTHRDFITDLRIRSIINQNQVLTTFHVVDEISQGNYLTPSNNIRRWMAERGFTLTDDKDTEAPEMLIGNDILEENIWTGRRYRIHPNLWAKETNFGWSVVGEEITSSKRSQANIHTCNLVSNVSDCMCRDLRTIFDADHLFEHEAGDWINNYINNIKFDSKERRYVVGLPWQQGAKVDLRNNFENAQAQAKRLYGRLQREGSLSNYNKAINAYVPEYAEPCGVPIKNSYYIPHHAVFKESATTKIRIVFNCSSSISVAKSLNQCLYKGEMMSKDVRPILIRFRLARQVATADLVKAFLQIVVTPADRDYLRYLWYDDEQNLKAFRMKTVLFGATSSPAILGAVLKKHATEISNRYPRAAEILTSASYMDDLVVTSNKEHSMDAVLDELKLALDEASFQMHKIHRNDDPESEVPCLGIKWFTGTDIIQLTSNGQLPVEPTVRETASYLASFYDPLGLVIPITIEGRKLMRSLSKKSWDAKLDNEQRSAIFEIKKQYDEILEYHFRRAPEADITNRFHVFGDASQEALCAVAYVQLENNRLFWVSARGRLAPMKSSETIPLLELKAAFLAAKLSQTIKQIFKNAKITLYSDSNITLARLKTNDLNKYPHNIAQWILKINEMTTDWRYVPTQYNPADIGTRPIKWRILVNQKLWWQGPNLAQIEKANQQPIETINDPTIRTVLVTSSTATTPLQTLLNQLSTNRPFLTKLYQKLDAKWKYIDRINIDKNRKLNLAQFVELQILKGLQKLQFPGGLENNTYIKDRSGFFDEWKLIRIHKRLDLTNLEIDAKFPIIIKQHPVVKKMARAIHEELLHAGADATYEHLSQVLHVIGGRKMVRDITRKCFHCNRVRGKPFDTPSAPLPEFRVRHTARAFDVIGLDAFGPILICRTQKYYGLLFTCATTRAVHLELIGNLKATTVLNALKRFIATRGSPSEIHSDNAKYFNTVSTNLRKIIDAAKKETEQAMPTIKWIYQPPMAPWWGGFFERMVGTVKRYLTSATWRKTLTPDELATVLKQVEAIVNSRPLVRLDEGALTPAHFFTGTALLDFSPLRPTVPAEQDILVQHKRLQNLLRNFWQRWTFSYLQQLKVFHHDVTHRKPKVGELVAIVEKLKPRYEWPIAQIVELHPGSDGQPRVATIRTLDKRILTRAIKLLVPLEATRTNPNCGSPSGAPEDVADRQTPTCHL